MTSHPVAVVGAGTMGAGIAQVAATAGRAVMLLDDDRDATHRARAAVADRLRRQAERGRISPAEAEAAVGRIAVVGSVDELAGAELVVEAVVEDLAVKRELFAALEKACDPAAILATNTSSLSIDDIAAGLARPGHVVGMHFFNPAPVLPLVEVVSGRRTEAGVAAAVAELARSWGKTPVHATSTPGFIVNRVARPFYAEGFRLLEDGVLEPGVLDAVLRESGGFRMGPCELTDLIGQDVNAAVTRSLWEAFDHDPRFAPSTRQEALVAQGRLGRKTGRGWYDPAGTAPRRDATAGVRERETGSEAGRPLELHGPGFVVRTTDGRTAAEHCADAGQTVVLVDLMLDPATAIRAAVTAAPDAPAQHVDAAIRILRDRGYEVTVLPDSPGLVVARTVAMLAAFAADAVDAGVASAGDVDTAMRLGVSYPLGPYEWGRQLGWGWVASVLTALGRHGTRADDAERYRVPEGVRRREAEEPAATDSTAAFDLARRAAAAMWSGDAASKALGMRIVEVAPGRATLRMSVRADMVNGHGICHGGVVFALADSAFAFACNSYNRSSVAQSCDITFLEPAHEGDALEAVAVERHRRGRTGVYDVTVTRGDVVVAEFRGRSREIPGRLVDDDRQRSARTPRDEDGA